MHEDLYNVHILYYYTCISLMKKIGAELSNEKWTNVYMTCFYNILINIRC